MRRERLALAVERGHSQRRAYELMQISETVLGYQPTVPQRDALVIDAMRRLARQYPLVGYRRIRDKIIYLDLYRFAVANVRCAITPAAFPHPHVIREFSMSRNAATQLLVSLLVACSLMIAGCESESEKASRLGFDNAYQMREIQQLGFKDYDSFKGAHGFNVESDSKAFAHAALGMPMKLFGQSLQNQYNIQVLPYVQLFSLDANNVDIILFSCSRADGLNIKASIDGIGCGPVKKEIIPDSRNYCDRDESGGSTFLIGNAFYSVDENFNVNEFGLTSSLNSIINLAKSGLCSEVKKDIAERKRLGFESVQEMLKARTHKIYTAAEWNRHQRHEFQKGLYASSTNLLEKTLVPSQSTQGDYDNFNNNGSLKVHGNWKGYLVSRAAWDYDNVTKTLKGYVLTVQTDIFSNPKKEATFNNLKKDLKFECDGEWESHGLNDSLFSRTDYSQCALQMSSDGSYRVTVTIK